MTEIAPPGAVHHEILRMIEAVKGPDAPIVRLIVTEAEAAELIAYSEHVGLATLTLEDLIAGAEVYGGIKMVIAKARRRIRCGTIPGPCATKS